MTNILKPGTKVRDIYKYSDTHVIVRKKKHQHAADVRYFGEDKANDWYIVKSDTRGHSVMMHRDMLMIRND